MKPPARGGGLVSWGTRTLGTVRFAPARALRTSVQTDSILSAQAPRPDTGDLRGHILCIHADPAANVFTPDGNNLAVTGESAAAPLTAS